MKKPFEYNQLSARGCIDCGKALKMNLVARKRDAPERCYKCHIAHEALGGHRMMGLKGVEPGPTFKRTPIH